jgi:hypothetical protein
LPPTISYIARRFDVVYSRAGDRRWIRVDEREIEMSKQQSQKHLDLRVRQVHANASMEASSEADKAKWDTLILRARRSESVRIVALRVGENVRERLRNRW